MMDRRKFLGRFGIGVGASILAPTVLTSDSDPKPKPEIKEHVEDTNQYLAEDGIWHQIQERGEVFNFYTSREGAKAFDDAVKALVKQS